MAKTEGRNCKIWMKNQQICQTLKLKWNSYHAGLKESIEYPILKPNIQGKKMGREGKSSDQVDRAWISHKGSLRPRPALTNGGGGQRSRLQPKPLERAPKINAITKKTSPASRGLHIYSGSSYTPAVSSCIVNSSTLLPLGWKGHTPRDYMFR